MAPVPGSLAADGRAISLTLGENVGAAVFRNGDWIMVVFDQPEALDLAALRRSEIFRAMETREGNDSTTLQMRLAQPATLRPRRNGNTWVLEAFRDAVEANRSLTAIVPEVDQGPPARLVLRTARPGRSVSVLDPETGSPLLVGTLREPGHAVAIARRQPEFQLLPAMLGVAVLPRGDNMQLRALNDRFVLQAARLDSLRLGEDAGREPLAEAATLSRIMDLPTASVAALQERLRAANANIAAAGPLGRTVHRRHAAEIAARAGVPFQGFWLEAPMEILKSRILARRGDASDATIAVLERAAKADPGPIDWIRLDAAGEAQAAARKALGVTG